MRFRRYDVDIPVELSERLEKALGAAIQKGLLPAGTGPRDFLVATVFTNGLAMVEADLKNRERETSLVLTPQEAAAQQWERRKRLSQSGLPGSGVSAQK